MWSLTSCVILLASTTAKGSGRNMLPSMPMVLSTRGLLVDDSAARASPIDGFLAETSVGSANIALTSVVDRALLAFNFDLTAQGFVAILRQHCYTDADGIVAIRLKGIVLNMQDF